MATIGTRAFLATDGNWQRQYDNNGNRIDSIWVPGNNPREVNNRYLTRDRNMRAVGAAILPREIQDKIEMMALELKSDQLTAERLEYLNDEATPVNEEVEELSDYDKDVIYGHVYENFDLWFSEPEYPEWSPTLIEFLRQNDFNYDEYEITEELPSVIDGIYIGRNVIYGRYLHKFQDDDFCDDIQNLAANLGVTLHTWADIDSFCKNVYIPVALILPPILINDDPNWGMDDDEVIDLVSDDDATIIISDSDDEPM
ncbi:hypothetical protein TVWG_00024 [Tetraselmis viridis virus N1]|uniref:Uncharacterized protein n=1 Tax=Tetraselmis viridis virus S1 TaxID=756285 RepID=M4QR66_9VIRU|nr:hypothetical protein TVSG_00004 [Tetraselmis viridis virus S1]AET84789.1 hypothetical protein TVWG_00024 [Tetraselmis viridis virus N1]AGH30804.1 hypothetical protein TVSG_00004 [Tetraselmis viridis virus S1]